MLCAEQRFKNYPNSNLHINSLNISAQCNTYLFFSLEKEAPNQNRSALLRHVFVPIVNNTKCAEVYDELRKGFQAEIEQIEKQNDKGETTDNKNAGLPMNEEVDNGEEAVPVLDVRQDMICAGWPKGKRDSCQVC